MTALCWWEREQEVNSGWEHVMRPTKIKNQEQRGNYKSLSVSTQFWSWARIRKQPFSSFLHYCCHLVLVFQTRRHQSELCTETTVLLCSEVLESMSLGGRLLSATGRLGDSGEVIMPLWAFLFPLWGSSEWPYFLGYFRLSKRWSIIVLMEV